VVCRNMDVAPSPIRAANVIAEAAASMPQTRSLNASPIRTSTIIMRSQTLLLLTIPLLGST
jgi:hypothetical protein